MNSLSPAKLAAYLAMIFLAGGATGAVVMWKSARLQDPQPTSVEKVCTRIQDRLKAKLGLTEEQLKRLQPVFEQTAQELRTVRAKAVHDTDGIICKAHQQISKELSPEQKVKLDEFDQERRTWIRDRFGVPLKAP